MGTSLTLFKIFGIEVRVHWSFILILIYGAFSALGSQVNPILAALYGILVILLLNSQRQVGIRQNISLKSILYSRFMRHFCLQSSSTVSGKIYVGKTDLRPICAVVSWLAMSHYLSFYASVLNVQRRIRGCLESVIGIDFIKYLALRSAQLMKSIYKRVLFAYAIGQTGIGIYQQSMQLKTFHRYPPITRSPINKPFSTLQLMQAGSSIIDISLQISNHSGANITGDSPIWISRHTEAE